MEEGTQKDPSAGVGQYAAEMAQNREGAAYHKAGKKIRFSTHQPPSKFNMEQRHKLQNQNSK